MNAFRNNVMFGQAALEHIDALYGYAMTLTRDTCEAEDLVQETYVRATAASNQPDSNSNLKGWLFVIMRNAWLNQLRHQNSGPRFVDLDANEPSMGEVQALALYLSRNPSELNCGTRLSSGDEGMEFAFSDNLPCAVAGAIQLVLH